MGDRNRDNMICSCGACFKGLVLYGKALVLYAKG